MFTIIELRVSYQRMFQNVTNEWKKERTEYGIHTEKMGELIIIVLRLNDSVARLQRGTNTSSNKPRVRSSAEQIMRKNQLKRSQ